MKPAHLMTLTLTFLSVALAAGASASAQYAAVDVPADAPLPVMLGNYNVERDFGLYFGHPQPKASGITVLQVAHGSLAESLNFRSGDIVAEIVVKVLDQEKRIPVTSPLQLASALGFHLEQPVRLTVQRGNERYNIAIQPDQIRADLIRGSMSRPMW